jgi:hypothetical protein
LETARAGEFMKGVLQTVVLLKRVNESESDRKRGDAAQSKRFAKFEDRGASRDWINVVFLNY